MSEESKSADAKAASGLHATAAPFVPVGPKAVKSSEGKANANTQDASATTSSNSAAGATNGTPAGAAQAAGDKSSTSSSTAATAGNQPPGNTSKAGNTGGKGKAGAKQSGGASSKLAAAAAAAPFVPDKQGTPAAQGPAAAAPAKETTKQGGKQGSKGGKHQQQQQARQQQQQQQKGQQQQKEPKEQKEQPQKDQKEQNEQQKEQQKDAKEVAKVPAKMSAAAAAFVPKSAPSTPSAQGTSNATSTPAGASNSQQQQSRGPAQASAAAARLKSPLKGGTAAASSINSSTPTATHASPARSTGAGGGRGGRGPRGEPPGSRSSNLGPGGGPGGPGMMPVGAGAMYGGAGGYGGGRGMPGGLPGLGSGPGGPKRALLAQFQGNYQYPGGAGGFGGYQHQQYHHHGSGAGKQLLSGQFMTEGLRQQLQQSNYLKQLQYTPASDEVPLPDKVAHYHTLYPLEDLAAADSGGVSSAWGVRTNILKGISAHDGKAYALRVVCGKQVIPSLEMLSVVRSAVDAWSCLAGHPGLLVPLEGLVASELDGSPSLLVVHAYIPGAVTMAQAHLHPTQTASGQLVRNTPSEDLLWSYTVQLAGVLRAAHASGLALRPASLSASKVLVTPVGRLKVSGLGVAEALTGEVVPASSEDLLQLQRDDVVAMGQLLLQLACAMGSLPAPSLDFASLHFSQDFVRLLVLLLGVADGGVFSWRAVSALLGERLLLEMDSLAMFNEQLLDDLGQEMENGRLFRLMSKLSFVTDRAPEGPGHGGPADTGDRYLLQLFRDFVFHQGELEAGRVLDWGHVVECLNKLDAGVSEQVLLQSRDERSLLVVSYADVKRCVEAAISELRTRGGNSQAAGVGSLMRPHPGAGVGHMFGMAGR